MCHARKPITARRLTLVTAVTAATVLLTAGPAFAHVEVESETAQALAEHVEISFDAEAESDTVGINKIRVVLPEGIAPADVAYGEGPKGWKFTSGEGGYTVEGAALKPGTNAEYSIVVKQLPDAKVLAFKTLQSYSDGRTDRWIELDENGENPAPVLKLKAAAPGAKPVSPSPSETEAQSPSATPDDKQSEPTAKPSSTDAKAAEDDGGLSAGAWVGIGAGILVLLAAALYLVRRGRTGSA
ncbi:DUF1775 domain-containing protein [Streptomyces sp. NPDC057582]|uniref:DUF1775 domain-containing protein n=1 Tax=Streptomyces sp. NPDC057582 TaxID=3346174 RepID=UPI00369579A8